MEFTFTRKEQDMTKMQMEMFVAIGSLPRVAPLEELFVLD
jgi:hypothetical protein